MIHETFKKTEIAKRYYQLKGIELDKEYARKRFFLDKNIDRQLLRKVFMQVYKEQKTLLK